MHREVTADLKVVYYRGRYWVAIAWSKVGDTDAAENPPIMDVDKSGQDEAVERRRKNGPSLQPVA